MDPTFARLTRTWSKPRLISLRTTISMTRPNRHIASPAHFGRTIAKFWAASQNYLSAKVAWMKRINCSITSLGRTPSNEAPLKRCAGDLHDSGGHLVEVNLLHRRVNRPAIHALLEKFL